MCLPPQARRRRPATGSLRKALGRHECSFVSGFCDERRHGIWLRHIDRVTALGFDHGRARAL